jgi:hypothetical protein
MSQDLTQAPLFQTLTSDNWQTGFSEAVLTKALRSLENGQLIYFPHLAFHLFPAEMPLLSTRFSTQKRKNISYNRLTDALHGTKKTTAQEHLALRGLLIRYAEHARQLIENLFPHYQPSLIWGRTSYRPVQITNRPTSFRKDDKRLHVDAFPASPNQGKRILRVFCNINPQGEDRLWRIGEPFEDVISRFLPRVKRPLPGSGALLKLLGVTKGLRTAYDHYMLHIHDSMKADEHYQKAAPQSEMRFPPGSTWIVQTDQVSHAAMSGQYLLEQTFYLPVEAMQDPRLSPLRILERQLGKKLT